MRPAAGTRVNGKMVGPIVRITDVDVAPIVMPKEDPSWRFALAATPDSHGFLVRIRTDDAHEGTGYTTAVPHLGAPADRVLADLQVLATTLRGGQVPSLSSVAGLGGSNQARCGIDVALHDLEARRLGVPLHRLLGGAVRREVSLLRILALKAPADVAANARRLVDEGYAYLKIKLDGDADSDVARIAAVRGAVGAAVHLTVDANQSYNANDAIRAAARFDRYGIELFEQPVPERDFDGLAEVARAIDIPVEADESAQSLEDVFQLAARGAVDSISLKLPKLGGITAARAAAAICAAAGVRCRVGATVGSRIIAAAALHFAAATPNIDYACELAEFARLRDDPALGLPIEHGLLRVPDDVGLGVRVREGVRA